MRLFVRTKSPEDKGIAKDLGSPDSATREVSRTALEVGAGEKRVTKVLKVWCEWWIKHHVYRET